MGEHMHNRFLRFGTVAAMVTLGVSLAPQPAMAVAPDSKRCTTGLQCILPVTGFPGGTVSIDVDVSGSGNGVFILQDRDSPVQCDQQFPASGGVRSFTCSGVAAGNLTGSVGGGSNPRAIGIRW